MPVAVMMLKGTDPNKIGLLPGMLDAADKRSAREQFDANYQHGGGWSPIKGFKFQVDGRLSYPGDPDLRPLAAMTLRDELILIYDHALVAIVQKGGAFEVARMD